MARGPDGTKGFAPGRGRPLPPALPGGQLPAAPGSQAPLVPGSVSLPVRRNSCIEHLREAVRGDAKATVQA